MYHAPSAKVTHMVLERNFCQSVRFNVQVDELHNINKDVEDGISSEQMYFEF
jgi:hypothetical protein